MGEGILGRLREGKNEWGKEDKKIRTEGKWKKGGREGEAPKKCLSWIVNLLQKYIGC